MTPSKPSPKLRIHIVQGAATLTIAFAILTGCESKQDAAIDQAKKQAIATGQPQQVVSTDKSGSVTTTTITPPAPGQTQPTITAVTAPATAANSAPTPATNNAPAPGAAPIVKPADVKVPAGTNLAIRINEHI